MAGANRVAELSRQAENGMAIAVADSPAEFAVLPLADDSPPKASKEVIRQIV